MRKLSNLEAELFRIALGPFAQADLIALPRYRDDLRHTIADAIKELGEVNFEYVYHDGLHVLATSRKNGDTYAITQNLHRIEPAHLRAVLKTFDSWSFFECIAANLLPLVFLSAAAALAFFPPDIVAARVPYWLQLVPVGACLLIVLYRICMHALRHYRQQAMFARDILELVSQKTREEMFAECKALIQTPVLQAS